MNKIEYESITHEMLDLIDSIENDNNQIPDWLYKRIREVAERAKKQLKTA